MKCNVNSGEILAAPRGPPDGSFAGKGALFRDRRVGRSTLALSQHVHKRSQMAHKARLVSSTQKRERAALFLCLDTALYSLSLPRKNINEHTVGECVNQSAILKKNFLVATCYFLMSTQSYAQHNCDVYQVALLNLTTTPTSSTELL